MEDDKNTYRLIILGADFSKFAGLPLGEELFDIIIDESKKIDLYHILEKDIKEYTEYISIVNGISKDKVNINLEDFISYLDIEHFLRLRGSDTWSDDGNRSQLLIRNLICKVVHQRQLEISDDVIDVYSKFVMNLRPDDIVITFNYDTILETCFKQNNIPYRYYQYRLKNINHSGAEVDRNAKEVVILKMHGSINWFDVTKYNKSFLDLQNYPYFQNPRHIVFQNQRDFLPQKLEGFPFHRNSPLNNIYTIQDVNKYLYKCQYVIDSPLILSPSYSKIVYLNPLKDLWDGMHEAGFFNQEMIIIGFSFSAHDDYLRMPIVNSIINFQRFNKIKKLRNVKNLKIIDFKESKEDVDEFKDRLKFVDWANTECSWAGFNSDSIEFLFNN